MLREEKRDPSFVVDLINLWIPFFCISESRLLDMDGRCLFDCINLNSVEFHLVEDESLLKQVICKE